MEGGGYCHDIQQESAQTFCPRPNTLGMVGTAEIYLPLPSNFDERQEATMHRNFPQLLASSSPSDYTSINAPRAM